MSEIDRLIQRADETKQASLAASQQLEQVRRTCQHSWGPVEYTPVYHKAYTIPGDEPGTMGIDWRGPTHIPSRTENIWRRTCTKCKLSQETRTTRPEIIAGQIPGTSVRQDVPDFPERVCR